MRKGALLGILVAGAVVAAAGVQVNGDFETGTGLGWTQWNSPWGSGFTYNYADTLDPYDGTNSFTMSANEGSFGVYQEFCVEPGVPFDVAWAWKGSTTGANGWWEVLVVDAPYTYERVDAPASHPETTMLEKWEFGFGGPYPPPSATWVEGVGGQITPTSDIVTVVLKCGGGGSPVQASFDNVTVTHAGAVLLTAISPVVGKAAGGEAIIVSGRNLPPDSVVTLGPNALVGAQRISTCTITGTAPAGAAGAVDVMLTWSTGTATLPGGYRYIGPPVITTIIPSQGPLDGGTSITITGSDFELPVTVLIGGAALADLDVPAKGTITGKTPSGSAGFADVVVTTPYGEVTVDDGFRYVGAPTITAIDPSQGPVDGGTSVTITGGSLGEGFAGATIGGATLTDMNVTDTTITGKTPSGTPGPADVVVTTTYGQATLPGGFTYVSTAPRFLRGDCNADGDVNIADPIALLGYLFADAAEPICLEACNGNDDGDLNIADPIAILGYLFGSTGQNLPPPSTECGTDPTTPATGVETQPCAQQQPEC
jgi:hypothetical protein